MSSKPRVLVVDDDADLRRLVGSFLASHGLEVESARDAREMDARLAASAFDVVILDLMMPGEDGLSVLRRWRDAPRPAVIMLSAMGEATDRIVGLEVGADDYLAKPCNPRELLARVRAVLRRREEGAGGGGRERRFDDWVLDVVARTARRGDAAPIALTDAEFRVLNAFLDRPQRVLTRDQLLDLAKGDAETYDRAVDVTISRLRRKLGEDDPIRTVRGEGYQLVARVHGR